MSLNFKTSPVPELPLNMLIVLVKLFLIQKVQSLNSFYWEEELFIVMIMNLIKDDKQNEIVSKRFILLQGVKVK